MTKRRNPFDDNHFLRKMHIGIKEVNLGVNCVENMKKVYENTYKMLFNGSTKVPKKLFEIQNGTKIENDYNSLHHNSNGHTNPPTPNNVDKNNELNPCCLNNQQIICSFCERKTCTNCHRTCHICNSEFCQLCSVLQYDSQEETAVCLSCM